MEKPSRTGGPVRIGVRPSTSQFRVGTTSSQKGNLAVAPIVKTNVAVQQPKTLQTTATAARSAVNHPTTSNTVSSARTATRLTSATRPNIVATSNHNEALSKSKEPAVKPTFQFRNHPTTTTTTDSSTTIGRVPSRISTAPTQSLAFRKRGSESMEICGHASQDGFVFEEDDNNLRAILNSNSNEETLTRRATTAKPTANYLKPTIAAQRRATVAPKSMPKKFQNEPMDAEIAAEKRKSIYRGALRIPKRLRFSDDQEVSSQNDHLEQVNSPNRRHTTTGKLDKSIDEYMARHSAAAVNSDRLTTSSVFGSANLVPITVGVHPLTPLRASLPVGSAHARNERMQSARKIGQAMAELQSPWFQKMLTPSAELKQRHDFVNEQAENELIASSTEVNMTSPTHSRFSFQQAPWPLASSALSVMMEEDEKEQATPSEMSVRPIRLFDSVPLWTPVPAPQEQRKPLHFDPASTSSSSSSTSSSSSLVSSSCPPSQPTNLLSDTEARRKLEQLQEQSRHQIALLRQICEDRHRQMMELQALRQPATKLTTTATTAAAITTAAGSSFKSIAEEIHDLEQMELQLQQELEDELKASQAEQAITTPTHVRQKPSAIETPGKMLAEATMRSLSLSQINTPPRAPIAKPAGTFAPDKRRKSFEIAQVEDDDNTDQPMKKQKQATIQMSFALSTSHLR